MKRSLTVVILVLYFTAGCASTGSDRNGDEPVAATGEVSAPLQEEMPEQTEQRDVSED